MATTFPTYVPFPLVQRQRAANFVRGVYDSTLSAATPFPRYDIGDIVQLSSGKVTRPQDTTTAANISKLAVAGQPWDMPKALDYFKDRGVPINQIDPDDEWVLTLAGTYDSAAETDVNGGENRELLWNATEQALTIRSGTTNPHVRMTRLFDGAVGDTNVLVAVRFLSSALF